MLGRVDVIVFTAGVGENDDIVRARALEGLEALGIAVDPERNAGRKKEPTIISPDWASTLVMVVPDQRGARHRPPGRRHRRGGRLRGHQRRVGPGAGGRRARLTRYGSRRALSVRSTSV